MKRITKKQFASYSKKLSRLAEKFIGTPYTAEFRTCHFNCDDVDYTSTLYVFTPSGLEQFDVQMWRDKEEAVTAVTEAEAIVNELLNTSK